MVIFDRDSTNFEIAMARGYMPTEAQVEVGKEFFGNLRVAHIRDRIM